MTGLCEPFEPVWIRPCIMHHYIFIMSQLRLTSHLGSTVVLLGTGTPGTSGEIYSEDDYGETGTCNPWITNPGSLAIELYSSKTILGKELSLSSWCIASLYIYIIGVLHHYIVSVSSRTTVLLRWEVNHSWEMTNI